MCIRDSILPGSPVRKRKKRRNNDYGRYLRNNSIQSADSCNKSDVHCLSAVSYTHLDVYKRQPINIGIVSFPCVKGKTKAVCELYVNLPSGTNKPPFFHLSLIHIYFTIFSFLIWKSSDTVKQKTPLRLVLIHICPCLLYTSRCV